jgi:hypothetical protein
MGWGYGSSSLNGENKLISGFSLRLGAQRTINCFSMSSTEDGGPGGWQWTPENTMLFRQVGVQWWAQKFLFAPIESAAFTL